MIKNADQRVDQEKYNAHFDEIFNARPYVGACDDCGAKNSPLIPCPYLEEVEAIVELYYLCDDCAHERYLYV